jgi:hypothetical protein
MTKPKSIDCVDMKRRAQRGLAKALAGQSPEEQTETLKRLAAESPLWKSLTKKPTKKKPRTARTRSKRRSTG